MLQTLKHVEIRVLHRGEVVFRNTCLNGILENQSNKYRYFKEITVGEKLLIKQLNRSLIIAVNSYKLSYKCNERERLYKVFI